MLCTIHHAKSQLSKLIEAALSGEEVIIAKGLKPVVRLVAIPQAGFKLGLLTGKVGSPPDFLEPLHAEELEAWEGK